MDTQPNTYGTISPRPVMPFQTSGRPIPRRLPKMPGMNATAQPGVATPAFSGINPGAALEAGGQLAGDISELHQLNKTNTDDLMPSYSGSPYEDVGAYQSVENPYKKGTGAKAALTNGLKYGAAGMAVAGPIGAAVGVAAGELTGLVKGLINGKKRRQFNQSQSRNLAQYQQIKQQQMDWQQKERDQQAQTDYYANRYAGAFEY